MNLRQFLHDYHNRIGFGRTLLSYGRIDIGMFMLYLFLDIVCVGSGVILCVQSRNVGLLLKNAHDIEQAMLIQNAEDSKKN